MKQNKIDFTNEAKVTKDAFLLPEEEALLPKNWIWTRLEELSIIITKGSTPTSYGFTYKKDGINFIKTENIDTEGNTGNISDFIDEAINEFLKRSILKVNDLLFSIAGTIGRVGIIKKHNLPANTNQALGIIRCLEGTNIRYLFYFLRSPIIQKEAINSVVGVGRANISLANLGAFKIPLPPLPEQQRIVAKIEELFSQLDAGVEALKKVRAELKRYRQAVLKYAFEGKLTEEWRTKYPPLPIAMLRGNGSPAPLPKEGTKTLNDLPESWMCLRLAEIGEIVTGTTPSKKKKEYYGNEFPFYKPSDLNNGYHVNKSDDGLSKEGIKKARLLPSKSILVTCIGATIGKVGLIMKEGASNQQINAIIPDNKVVPEFLYFICISPQFQKSIIETASATTLPILNKSKFSELYFSLPSLAEQQEIVSEIERRFSVTDEVERTVGACLQQAQRLRQSILKRAFEGKLVPQDPNDEPASVLLERIKLSKKSKDSKKESRKGKTG